MPCRRAGAEAVAQAAAAHGARLIHVSAIGADENSTSAYARAKADGEKRVLAAVPGATIFRPSIVFGPDDDFFNRFAALARIAAGAAADRRRRTPGSSRSSSAMSPRRSPWPSTADAKPGTIYELGGPEVFTFKELMEFVLATIERRRLLVPMPFWAAKLQAAFLQFLPKPLLTPDQVELLRRDNVVSDEREHATAARWRRFGIAPHAVAAIVPNYLWRFRKTGQFQGRAEHGLIRPRRALQADDMTHHHHRGFARAGAPARAQGAVRLCRRRLLRRS